MFPFIDIIPWIQIYTFGLSVAICFFIFIWNLERLSKRFSYSFGFFSQNIIWFFLSTFIFSRIFYVISKWHDMKFISNPLEFFLMGDFNFSLFGAIFWFLLVLHILVKLEKVSISRYIDGITLSFLLVAIIGYIGALLWWQVYGRETMIGIEISYTNAYSPVPFQVPIFPLPIVYSLLSFIILSILYIVSLFVHVRGYIWYIWIIAFSAMILIFEFFSGKQDIVSINTFMNFPQLCALVTCLWAWFHLYKLFAKETSESSAIHHV